MLLEAAALGVPLLAARVAGMVDLLVEGEHGFLFAPGDRHECRRAVYEALQCPEEKLRDMGTACRRLVAEEYTHEREATRYMEILERIASPGDTP